MFNQYMIQEPIYCMSTLLW